MHGPSNPGLIRSLDDLPPDVSFEDEVVHHIVDTLDAPGLPASEVVFHHAPPPAPRPARRDRAGLPHVHRADRGRIAPQAGTEGMRCELARGRRAPLRRAAGAALARPARHRPRHVRGPYAAGPAPLRRSPCSRTSTERRASRWAWRRSPSSGGGCPSCGRTCSGWTHFPARYPTASGSGGRPITRRSPTSSTTRAASSCSPASTRGSATRRWRRWRAAARS